MNMVKLMAMVGAIFSAAVGLADGARLDISGETARSRSSEVKRAQECRLQPTDTLFVDAAAPAGGDGSAARPFASPTEALARLRSPGRGARPVTLRFKAGNYFLPDGFTLGAGDSHLLFVGETGVRFTRAEKATPGGVVKCDAARPPDSETYRRMAPHAPMFFYDGKWAVEARWPNEDWAMFTAKDVVDSGLRSRCLSGIAPDKPTVPGSFRFANDRPARWDFDSGVWLAGYTTHDWSFERVRLASFTPSNRLVRLAGSVPFGLATGSWSEHNGRRFFIYGAKSELDAPGEYFYDRKTGRVDFIAPKEGVREFLAVTREGPIVSVKGATDVSFEGIAFEYACGDAVSIEDATNVVVRDSMILNVGGSGVALTGGCGCRVERTEIAHCGFGGVRVSGGDRRTLTRADHLVADCEIHDFSRICRTYRPAVSVAGCGITVRGCRIHDAPHSGVIYGGNDHLFADNEVWDILRESGDAGAFYTGRDPTSRGNVLRGNYVHDIGHPERGSVNTMAFYIDDCDAGDTIVSNRVVNVPRGVMLGGGHDNHLIGNTFERCNLAISVDARGVMWNDRWDSKTDKSWQMTRKVKETPVDAEPWKSRYPLLVDYLNDHPREPRHISIVGNRFINCKRIYEWGNGMKDYLHLLDRRDNEPTREETLEWFRHEMYGCAPIGRPSDEKIGKDTVSFGRFTIHVHCSLPKGADSDHPAPVFLFGDHFNAANSKTRTWEYPGIPTNSITARGYAYVRINFNDVAPNTYCRPGQGGSWSNGVHSAYGVGKGDDWGTLSAWAWAFSRTMDWIETRSELNAREVAVLGHSRGGKTALWAAAQDERFAMGVSSGSGTGGARLLGLEIPEAEHIKDMMDGAIYFWFCPNFRKYIGKEPSMPHDADDLLGLISPRLAYVSSGSQDDWAGPRGEFEAARRASRHWEKFGKTGLALKSFGLPGTVSHEGSIGYHLHDGPHELNAYDWARYMDFADRHFHPVKVQREVRKTGLTACQTATAVREPSPRAFGPMRVALTFDDSLKDHLLIAAPELERMLHEADEAGLVVRGLR